MPLALRAPDPYGAGLSRFLQAKGHSVVEVNRPNRQLRHQNGKSDPLDAESAARAVLGGQANARPKSTDSSVEMIRHLKVARDTAVKSRTQAMVTLKTLIINAPAALRQALDRIIGKMALIRHLAALRAYSLGNGLGQGCLAGHRAALADARCGNQGHDAALEALTASCAPAMLEAHGISTGTAAEMLILVGDNPERIRSEAAFAKLWAPVRFQPRAGKRTDIASIGATSRLMLPCIAS
jgi:transposase